MHTSPAKYKSTNAMASTVRARMSLFNETAPLSFLPELDSTLRIHIPLFKRANAKFSIARVAARGARRYTHDDDPTTKGGESMFPMETIQSKLQEVLDRLDDFKDSGIVDDLEDFEELNAEFEDALFTLECADPDDEDWAETVEAVADELGDLCARYSALLVPELEEDIELLSMLTSMALESIEN
jgi:hypothetical protein